MHGCLLMGKSGAPATGRSGSGRMTQTARFLSLLSASTARTASSQLTTAPPDHRRHLTAVLAASLRDGYVQSRWCPRVTLRGRTPSPVTALGAGLHAGAGVFAALIWHAARTPTFYTWPCRARQPPRPQPRRELGGKLILLSTSAIGQNLRGQPPDFDTTAIKNLHGDTWTGFTNFVARWNRPINVPSVDHPHVVNLDGRALTITRAHLWSEIDRLGPLLAATIQLFDQVAGVIRVVRSDPQDHSMTTTVNDCAIMLN